MKVRIFDQMIKLVHRVARICHNFRLIGSTKNVTPHSVFGVVSAAHLYFPDSSVDENAKALSQTRLEAFLGVVDKVSPPLAN